MSTAGALGRGGRTWLAAAGVAVLAATWLGPLPAWARDAFAAHMTMHMGVVACAAPLLAIALAGGPLDPARRAPALFAPIPASAVELAVVWGWHAPALHHAARSHVGWMAAEQGSFLAAGLLLWLSALGGDRHARDERAGAGIAGLLLTSMHMTLLGALLVLSPRPLYDHPAVSAWGMAPLTDQHLGGALMLTLGGAVYLAGGLVLVAGLVRGSPPDARVAATGGAGARAEPAAFRRPPPTPSGSGSPDPREVR